MEPSEFKTIDCKTQDHVKALICHEFLHILLRHTERSGPASPAEHVALDAVINAIIHRELGPAYSSMIGQAALECYPKCRRRCRGGVQAGRGAPLCPSRVI